MQKDQSALARAIKINERFDRALASLSSRPAHQPAKCTNAKTKTNKKPLYVSAIGLVLALILTSIATDSQARRRHVRVIETARCVPDDRYACASIFQPTTVFQIFEPLAPRISHHRKWKVTKRKHHVRKAAKKMQKPRVAVAKMPPPPVRPEVITQADKESIFERYQRSREIIARPGVREVENLPPRLKALLVKSAEHFKCAAIITSAYRDPAHNRRVGGATRSQHLRKRATDFRMACVDASKLYAFVAKQKGINGLGYYGPKGIIHADTRPGKQRVTWGISARQRFAHNGYSTRRVRYARHRG